jgi:hypothetical protein
LDTRAELRSVSDYLPFIKSQLVINLVTTSAPYLTRTESIGAEISRMAARDGLDMNARRYDESPALFSMLLDLV